MSSKLADIKVKESVYNWVNFFLVSINHAFDLSGPCRQRSANYDYSRLTIFATSKVVSSNRGLDLIIGRATFPTE